jgi:trehalose 6-phosphate phosphatase
VYESPSRSDNADLAQRVIDILSGPDAALVTDIDGTISAIVAVPSDAFVLPKARDALLRLRDLLAVVAVVTGRSVDDARAMVGVDGLAYIGNHGLEVWSKGAATLVPEARPWVPRIAAVLQEIQDRNRVDGVIIEDKGATASLHYRLAKDPVAARRELLEIVAGCAGTSGVRVEEGRMVINLLPPLTVTKGSAVSWLAREHKLERIVYLGDDITDAHAFRALTLLRQTGDVETLGIGVVGPETAPVVRQIVDAQVPTVEAVADLLCAVVDGLKASDTMKTRAPTIGSD